MEGGDLEERWGALEEGSLTWVCPGVPTLPWALTLELGALISPWYRQGKQASLASNPWATCHLGYPVERGGPRKPKVAEEEFVQEAKSRPRLGLPPPHMGEGHGPGPGKWVQSQRFLASPSVLLYQPSRARAFEVGREQGCPGLRPGDFLIQARWPCAAPKADGREAKEKDDGGLDLGQGLSRNPLGG